MKDRPIHAVITHAKFGDDRLRGSGVVAGQISAFPIDFACRPYNTLTLPCERVISGVPQGSVFGTDLFLLYINGVRDLFADLSVSLKLYDDDDIKLYSHCDVSSSSDLDSAIGQLYNWSNTWQLQIAVDLSLIHI